MKRRGWVPDRERLYNVQVIVTACGVPVTGLWRSWWRRSGRLLCWRWWPAAGSRGPSRAGCVNIIFHPFAVKYRGRCTRAHAGQITSSRCSGGTLLWRRHLTRAEGTHATQPIGPPASDWLHALEMTTESCRRTHPARPLTDARRDHFAAADTAAGCCRFIALSSRGTVSRDSRNNIIIIVSHRYRPRPTLCLPTYIENDFFRSYIGSCENMKTFNENRGRDTRVRHDWSPHTSWYVSSVAKYVKNQNSFGPIKIIR